MNRMLVLMALTVGMVASACGSAATASNGASSSPTPQRGGAQLRNGAAGQLGIAGVAPGDGPYHGGAWAVNSVTFNDGVTPYLLTSDEAVFAAQAAGDVTVTRNPDADFRCPVQP